MQYVNVISTYRKTDFDLTPAIINQNRLCLYSLIDGFRHHNFNSHTVNDVLRKMRAFINLYLVPISGKFFIDSGGYSVIKGLIHPENIPRMIQCYNMVLRDQGSLYDSIFSLDIPMSAKYRFMNNKSTIYELNYNSLQQAITGCLADPEYQGKYRFVWHFKMQSQYDIWCMLYSKLNLNTIVKNRAIGGMVSLRGTKAIEFSPFIGMAYRCFLDYLESQDFIEKFTLHYLGMYLQYDRFQMALLESLFDAYLEGSSKAWTTYDSINFEHTTRMNKNLKFFYLDNGELIDLPNLVDIPRTFLKKIYSDDQLLDYIELEIERRKEGLPLEDSNSFAPINIYSQRQVDLFFEKIIEDYQLSEVFFREKSLTAINGYFSEVLETLGRKNPDIFTRHVKKCLMNNVRHTYTFHRWFVQDRSRDSLQGKMTNFIREINFPDLLR